MKQTVLLPLIIGVILFACGIPDNQQGLTEEEINAGFTKIFNGNDLDGWQTYHGADWSVQVTGEPLERAGAQGEVIINGA